MRRTRFILPVALVLGLAACSDSTSGPSEGRLTIRMTDAPGDVKEAWIKIDQFVLLRSSADSADTASNGRIEIEPSNGGYINLMTLVGGNVMDVVNSAEVPTGTYSELRLVLDDAYVVLKDGRVFATAGATLPVGSISVGTLKCPSCSQSGFKVKFTNGLNVTSNSLVTIDFDVAQSFGHEAGNSGQFILRPVLRATSSTTRYGFARGAVTLAQGVTLPACGGAATSLTQFKPFAVIGNDTITGVVDATGAYRISNLLPGAYTLGSFRDITFTNGDSLTVTAAATPATFTLAAQGDSTTAAYNISAATCH